MRESCDRECRRLDLMQPLFPPLPRNQLASQSWEFPPYSVLRTTLAGGQVARHVRPEFGSNFPEWMPRALFLVALSIICISTGSDLHYLERWILYWLIAGPLKLALLRVLSVYRKTSVKSSYLCNFKSNLCQPRTQPGALLHRSCVRLWAFLGWPGCRPTSVGVRSGLPVPRTNSLFREVICFTVSPNWVGMQKYNV